MTDNEALAETIRNYLESGTDLLLTDDDYKTIIKALEQEPKEIYAKGYTDGQRAFAEHIELCKEEQEPKTGHWKSTIDRKPICSECGFVSESEDGYFVSHYCPNCGCRMVEPQESDHKCHTCKHYTSGENDGSCGSYICKEYSDWESEG